MKRVAASLMLLLAASCAKGKATAPQGVAGGGDFAMTALPADVRVVIHLDMTKLRGSRAALTLVDQALDRDPDAHAHLKALVARCKLDPVADLDEITVGMDDQNGVAVLARGKVDENAVAECVKAELAAGGGSLTVTPRAGVPPRSYAAVTKSGQKAWFVFGPHSVAVVSAEPWLGKLLDPKAPRLESNADTMALVKRVDAKAAFWGVGYPPPGVGEQLVKVAGLSAPLTAIAFEATLDKGLSAALKVDLKTDGDAAKLAELVKTQMDWLAIAAQRVSLGTLVAKAKTTSERNVVKVSLQLDEAELDRLVAALAPRTQTNGNGNGTGTEKKEQ